MTYRIAAASLLCSLVACKTTAENQASLKHDLGVPVPPDVHEFLFVEASDEELKEKINDPAGLGGQDRILSQKDPLTVRAQYWLDALDEHVRSKHPGMLDAVPPPVAAVYVNSTQPNAWITGAGVCFELALPVVVGNGGAGVSVDAATYQGRRFSKAADSELARCLERKLDEAKSLALLAAVAPDCQFQKKLVAGQDVLTSAAGCDFKGGGAAKIQAIYRDVTVNRVNIFTGLFTAKPDERWFVAFLAHELGHYYRAHTADWEGKEPYGYFYRLGPINVPFKPKPDPSVAGLGERALTAGVDGGTIARHRRIPGQIYRTELYGTMTRLVPTLKALGGACASLQAPGTFPGFPGLLPEGAAAAHLAFEKRVQACGESVAMSSDALWAKLQTEIGKVSRVSRLVQGMQRKSNLAEQLAHLSELIVAKQQATDAVLKEAEQIGLGYYTREQNADDVSMEWMEGVGFSAKVVPDHWLFAGANLQKRFEDAGAKDFVTDVDMGLCKTLYENDWKDPDGKVVAIPVAIYEHQHHGACFRVYNQTREIAAHGYQTTERSPPPAPAEAWESVQTKAAQASQVGLETLSLPEATMPRRTRPAEELELPDHVILD